VKDDYLWDRSGEADPELGRIERELGGFRYRPRPLDLSAAPELMTWGRPMVWARYAAAAAVVFALLAAGMWVALHRSQTPSSPQTALNNSGTNSDAPTPRGPVSQPGTSTPAPPQEPRQGTPAPNVTPKPARRAPAESPAQPASDTQVLAASFLDPEFARHIEKAQLLLRAFRNSAPSDDDDGTVDVSYEKQQSQEILHKNMLLRREAELKGDMPAGELLGSLEPLLLDIANLPDNAPEEDVRGIKDRIQREEIVAALQSYSTVMGSGL